MILLTSEIRFMLRTNDAARLAALLAEGTEPDPAPVLKLFDPAGGAAQGSSDAFASLESGGGAATWLATELDADDDTLFGLADLGFGCPELGSFSLREIMSVRLPFGLRIERDIGFSSPWPLSMWADFARREGSIMAAERALAAVTLPDLLPSRSGSDGSDG